MSKYHQPENSQTKCILNQGENTKMETIMQRCWSNTHPMFLEFLIKCCSKSQCFVAVFLDQVRIERSGEDQTYLFIYLMNCS